MQRARVDFPLPERPMTTKTWPRFIFEGYVPERDEQPELLLDLGPAPRSQAWVEGSLRTGAEHLPEVLYLYLDLYLSFQALSCHTAPRILVATRPKLYETTLQVKSCGTPSAWVACYDHARNAA